MLLKFPTWKQTHKALTRKKTSGQTENGKLAKVLTTLDLTALGVGSTLGVGVYVLAGDVAKSTAGPAVIISFLIAALASILAGLCYAEFGARVPKAGSAYVYSYVCIGEFCAFIIGWNLILEYLIGSASCVKALFLYFDSLANQTMSGFFTEHLPMTGGEIGTYADVFSLGMALVFAIALAFGAKESSIINNIFTLVNISVVLLVIGSGLFKINTANWSRSKVEAGNYGDGGFAPYGIKGIIKGAARCFYGFIGFDCIATAGEEAKTPKKSIPIGVVTSLLIVFLAYFGVSTVLTLMLPYYEQDPNAPLAHAYTVLGWTAIKYTVTVGAVCALFSSLLGAMFPLPRIIYAMSNDGLIFKTLGRVHPKFHTPFMGTLLAGALTGVLACILELSKLTDMMSIGTLLAYSMVAACVLKLRYSSNIRYKITCQAFMSQMFNANLKQPSNLTSTVVSVLIVIFFGFCFILGGIMRYFEEELYEGTIWLICVCVALLAFLSFLLVLISFQPKEKTKTDGFKVPLVPWIPGISIFVNIYLMTNIAKDTWIKYSYWMLIGLAIYFIYGIWHSSEKVPLDEISKTNVPKENGNRKKYGSTSESVEQIANT